MSDNFYNIWKCTQITYSKLYTVGQEALSQLVKEYWGTVVVFRQYYFGQHATSLML